MRKHRFVTPAIGARISGGEKSIFAIVQELENVII
jgi:hypothetical protein